MNHPLAIGIDVGGTSIKAALVDSDGVTTGLSRTATPKGDTDGGKTAAVVAEIAAAFHGAHPSASVGVAVPGVVNEDQGVVVTAVNLGWQNVPFKSLVEEILGRDIAFGQDVRTGALAEAAKGAASHSQGVSVFVPIGTGVAAGIVAGGVPLASAGWAGEIGQMTISAVSALDGLRFSRSLESIASASAVARRIGCADGKEAVRLVRDGDARATSVWFDALEALAEALAWTTAVVAPEVIVIGGGLAEAGDILLNPLELSLARRLGVLRLPEVVKAQFGDEAATVGAGLSAHSMLSARR